MKRLFTAAFASAMLLTGTFATSASAITTFQSYNMGDAGGNQSFSGSLGLDFDVNSAINILGLGAFDAGADGFTGSIRVEIFNLNNTSSPLVSATITGSGNPLLNNYRFARVSPFKLLPGSYSVVAFGYGDDQNGNENVGSGIPLSTDDGGGLISFVNSRFGSTGNPSAFPTNLTVGNFPCSGSAEACFAAGSFVASAVPLPAALPLFATALVGLGFMSRRRRKAA